MEYVKSVNAFVLPLLAFQICLTSVESYNLTCPSQAHWKIRAIAICNSTLTYFCVYNNVEENYVEGCTGPDWDRKGSKRIFSGSFTRGHCFKNRYQPFNFQTNGSMSNCIYRKSICSEEGQIVYKDDSTIDDRTCRCNFKKNYSFLKSPKQFCYCNPVVEDCSCYIKSCPVNLTLSADYDCISNGYQENQKCIDISKHHGIYTVPEVQLEKTNLLNTTLVTWRESDTVAILVCCCIVVLAGFCLFEVLLVKWTSENYQHFKRYLRHRREHTDRKENVQSITNSEKNEYLEKINSGKETRQYVRIQVIGKEGVGKSSLVHRLLGKQIEGIKSTDGIEIFKSIQIRKDDGKWIVDKVETERLKRIRRIMKIADINEKPTEISSDTQNTSVTPSVTGIVSEPEPEKQERIASKKQKCVVPNTHDDIKTTTDNLAASLGLNPREKKLDSSGEVTSNVDKSLLVTIKPDKKKSGVHDHETLNSLEITDEMTAKIFENMDEILLEVKKGKEELKSGRVVECGIWDFAGQKDYYVTHQTFLTSGAIYLLVANLKEDIKAIRYDENCDSIGEYIDFWFDSIHSFCKNPDARMLNPPVIMVCTHTDQCEKLDERISEYAKQFDCIIGQNTKANHKRNIHYISNTHENGEIDELKKTISKIAEDMSYFQVELPTHWIQLENALDFLTNDLKKNILSWTNILELGNKMLIKREGELLEFLNYQHNIGNIIFFNDIREYIILQPNWLVKCFRCLVCDDDPKKRNPKISSTEWKALTETGRLSDTIIDDLFQNENVLEKTQKTYVLRVMEKFDIIVKPQCVGTKGDEISKLYYIPCMIRNRSISVDDLKKEFEVDKEGITISPWFILEFTFLPFAYFNHILVSYIKEYTVCGKENEEKAIYEGKAVIFLDERKSRKLIICYSKNAISLQVWKWDQVSDDLYQNVLEKLHSKIEELENKLGPTSYTVAAKCNDGNYFKKDYRISFEERNKSYFEDRTYFCKDHVNAKFHNINDIENMWFRHVDTIFKMKEKVLQRKERLKEGEQQPFRNTELTTDEVNFLRMTHLLVRVACPVVRMYFDKEIQPDQLRKTLDKYRSEMVTRYRKNKTIIDDFQWHLLYGPNIVTSNDFDIRLMTYLLSALAKIEVDDLNPVYSDTRTNAMLSRIKCISNETLRNFEGQLSGYEFNKKWECIGQAVLKLASSLNLDTKNGHENIRLIDRLLVLNPKNIDAKSVREFIYMSESCPGVILQKVIYEYCASKSETIEEILRKEKHQLYHKRIKNVPCCICPSGSIYHRFIPEQQWKSLYSKHEGCYTPSCQSGVKPCIERFVPKILTSLDLSLSKTLILNIPDILTYVIDRLNIRELDQFLLHNQHVLYHSMEGKMCCKCQNVPTEKIVINREEWNILFKKEGNMSCHQGIKNCCCQYSIRNGIKFTDLEDICLSKIFTIAGPIGVLNKIEQDALLYFLHWSVDSQSLNKALSDLSNMIEDETSNINISSIIFNQSKETTLKQLDARTWIDMHLPKQEATGQQQLQIIMHDDDGLYVRSIRIPGDLSLPCRTQKFNDLTTEENNYLVVVYGLTKIVYPIIKNEFRTQCPGHVLNEIRVGITEKQMTAKKSRDIKKEQINRKDLCLDIQKQLCSSEELKNPDFEIMINILKKRSNSEWNKVYINHLDVTEKIRREICQSSSGILDQTTFNDIISRISKAVLHLGGEKYKDELSRLRHIRNIFE